VGNARVVATVSTAVLAVIAALLVSSLVISNGSSERPTKPSNEARRAHAVVTRSTLLDMMRGANVIFVGKIASLTDGEPISPPILGYASPRTRIASFDVQRKFRGVSGDTVAITMLNVEGNDYPFTIGDSYLMFGENVHLGRYRIAATIPLGYVQGIYRLLDQDTAFNEFNGKVDLTTLAHSLYAYS
jgi:hypothetical protein